MQSYILDNSSPAEYQRLDLMSKILDPRTRDSLTVLGVCDGWNCLELGGGNGSMTEWLCEKVGTSGSDHQPQRDGVRDLAAVEICLSD